MFVWKQGFAILASLVVGGGTASAFDGEVRGETGSRSRGLAVAPGGDAYFLVDRGDALSLRRIAFDGTERWRTDVPGARETVLSYEDDVAPADDQLRMAFGDSIVCVVPSPRYRRKLVPLDAQTTALVACFDRASGTPWLSRTPTPLTRPIPTVSIEGDVVTWFEQVDCVGSCKPHVDEITSAPGRADVRRTLAQDMTATAAARGSDGSYWLGLPEPKYSIGRIERNGNFVWPENRRVWGVTVRDIQVKPTGAVHAELESVDESTVSTRSVEVDLDALFTTLGASGFVVPRKRVVVEQGYVIERAAADHGARDAFGLAVTNEATRRLRWRIANEVPSNTDVDDVPAPTLAFDAASGLAFTTVDSAGQPLAYAHRPRDGVIVGFERMRCADARRCAVRETAVDAASGVYAIAADARADDGSTWAVLRWIASSAITKQAPATALQPGIRGFWNARETPGQGLTFDIAGSAVIGSWFTYGDQDLPEWYVLQGELPMGEKLAALSVYAMRAPAVAIPNGSNAPVLTRLGDARLAVFGCDRLKFSYALSGPETTSPPRTGVIVLDRATARNFPCTETDAPPAPEALPAPARGFERGQTGAWADAARANQGIVFDVRPPSAADGGQVVGAWYLPGGEWFTVQALIGDAVDGRVTAPIYRSIGGARDRKPSTSIVRVGTATVDFDGCGAATFDYQFDEGDAAGFNWRGKAGRWNLARVTACARDID